MSENIIKHLKMSVTYENSIIIILDYILHLLLLLLLFASARLRSDVLSFQHESNVGY